ncbi:vomeronasal type-2 receptor 26-like [Gastrophryne carolinensis]
MKADDHVIVGATGKDSEICHTCPDNEWPNKAKDKCVLKLQEYLSYDDIVALLSSVFSLLLFIGALFINGIFILFRDTPIVKANNRSLSFILLISLKLSLLSVFLFIGRPSDISCKLRQICFCVFFTVALSSVLAKTTMVCISFKATRPNSSWSKCVGAKLPNSVMGVCSSIQVLAGTVWLSSNPPFQDFDIYSFPEKIVVYCNEGSVLAFYFMLGYMGLLATVSFILAFMVRTLPDIFNEAKYITFSMLVFCSVWVSAIPAYLSTKGKNVVIVEIFATLTSSAGVMCCIFLPKCYIILRRKDMNTKMLINIQEDEKPKKDVHDAPEHQWP